MTFYRPFRWKAKQAQLPRPGARLVTLLVRQFCRLRPFWVNMTGTRLLATFLVKWQTALKPVTLLSRLGTLLPTTSRLTLLKQVVVP